MHQVLSFDVPSVDESEIRIRLIETLICQAVGSAIILEELGLCQGEARVDVAIVSEELEGYEIKSERDSLDRLESQIRTYNRVLDRITLVTCERHLAKAEQKIPRWWGLDVVHRTPTGLAIQTLRPAEQNAYLDPHAFVQLLWRDDALSVDFACGGREPLGGGTGGARMNAIA